MRVKDSSRSSFEKSVYLEKNWRPSREEKSISPRAEIKGNIILETKFKREWP